jgi:hypothetical protein
MILIKKVEQDLGAKIQGRVDRVLDCVFAWSASSVKLALIKVTIWHHFLLSLSPRPKGHLLTAPGNLQINKNAIFVVDLTKSLGF